MKYFGLIAYVYPFLLIVLGYFVYKNFKKFDFDFAQFVVGIFLFFIAFLMFQALTTSGANSGVIGGFIVSALKEVIGAIGTAVTILMIFIISLGLAFRENFIIVLRKAFVDKEPNGYEEKSRSVKEVRARQIPKIERKKPKAEEIKEEELIDAQVLNDDEPNFR
ncbi:DNA translocase FtsK 4TM domain-containing protein [Campylobacter concisus]